MDKNKSRACILNYPVDVISIESALEFTEKMLSSSKGIHVVTLNPEMIAQAKNNKGLDDCLKQAELVVPDGIGVVVALKTLGINIKRVPGIEYSEKLIEICANKGYKVGFIGASQEVIELATQELQSKYPTLNVVYKRNGFFAESDEALIREELTKASPDALFVALGVPKQELWISKYREILAQTVMVGVGGSFDVWAKKVKRAPLFFRKLGLEWFYRLLSEPSRFSSMFPTLPLFLVEIVLDGKNNRKEY